MVQVIRKSLVTFLALAFNRKGTCLFSDFVLRHSSHSLGVLASWRLGESIKEYVPEKIDLKNVRRRHYFFLHIIHLALATPTGSHVSCADGQLGGFKSSFGISPRRKDAK